jgi:hypothetical protein
LADPGSSFGWTRFVLAELGSFLADPMLFLLDPRFIFLNRIHFWLVPAVKL